MIKIAGDSFFLGKNAVQGYWPQKSTELTLTAENAVYSFCSNELSKLSLYTK